MPRFIVYFAVECEYSGSSESSLVGGLIDRLRSNAYSGRRDETQPEVSRWVKKVDMLMVTRQADGES